MLDVKRLVLLRDLAEYGTVTAVAELHRVTPSAVSQQLRALEEEAGAVLLHREGRTVRLTATGHALAARCEDVLAALEGAQGAVRALDGRVAGDLRVGCAPSALEPVAAPLVAELARRHPGLRPHLVEDEPETALPRLRRRDLDLVIGYRYRDLGTPLPPGVAAHRLFDDPLVLAVPERLRAAVERDGLGVLADESWISAPEPSTCRTVLLHACRTAGFGPAIRHELANLRAALPLVAAGLGVTILPALMTGSPPPGVALLPSPGRGRVVEAVVRAGGAGHPAVAAALASLRGRGSGRGSG
ncbi:LysR family transcriptional regulator [Actinomadura kijaniata]|uniref:DNA-binding transcriptional LysR family regulator n=1 Tax=Actinomadura namibiensis TaxID=182080 RepID=A0A7W3LKA8_ACTNM|nr:LysR family transcriptional regulator [Actinomadura namibiensis]MBA8949628.1 DNA-binding transcriptional LysR family regulator [Actinomadura namibiensis]